MRWGFVDVGGKVASISLGYEHTCALLDGGSVKCWGRNSNGQLGLGNTGDIGDNEHPSSIAAINLGGQAVEIVAGSYTSCAKLTTGNIKCWGNNNSGALGLGFSFRNNNIIGDHETPNTVGTISLGSTVSQFASGSYFSCATLDGGDVRCWGWNAYGQLGLGHTRNIGRYEHPSSQPVLDLPEDALQVATGNSHACALLQSGNIRCWGWNQYGQLGQAHRNNIGDNETLLTLSDVVVGGDSSHIYPRFSFSPMNARSPATIRFDASSSFSKAAISSHSWDFGNEETGSGQTASTSFSSHGLYTVNLTLTDDLDRTSSIEKKIRIYPANDSPLMPQNQKFTLEQGKSSLINLPPATDRGGDALTYRLVDSPSQGTLTECLNSNTDLSCKYTAPSDFTGTVTFSYVANDGTSDALYPAQVELNVVEPLPSILQIASRDHHTCVLFDNKKIKCWGWNFYGQLGLGYTGGSIGDNETVLSQGFVNVGANVLQISLGESHTCVLLEDKNVKCWGRNTHGVLGPDHPLNADISDPSSIQSLNVGFPVKQIASGRYFNCVLGESGQVKCWGENTNGQLGYGHTNHLGDSSIETFSRIPFVEIGGEVQKLSLGYSHACALLTDGNVKCWGDNSFGQLGLGHENTIGDNELPSSVGTISLGQTALDISVGYWHSCAVLADKNIRCWGRNSSGELSLLHANDIGDDELPSTAPIVDPSEDIKRVFAGIQRTCALFENDSVKCWGDASNGISGHIVPFRYFSHIDHPGIINFGAPVDQVALGRSHSCAALRTGEVRCWGWNSSGQLGLGHVRSIGDNEFITAKNSSTFSEARSSVIAHFDYSVSGTDPKSITFDTSSSFATSSIKTYQWDFGDDETSTSTNPTHEFSEFGSFNVTLTVTDNFDQTAVASRLIQVKSHDASPYFGRTQEFTLEKAKTHVIQLGAALDPDSSSLTYTVVQSPSQGTLSDCLSGMDDLICSYEAPSDFTGEVEFSYKANDGTSDSLATTVKLHIIDAPLSILQMASGLSHTCALYENKKVKCWEVVLDLVGLVWGTLGL